jgi:hypothetical protein
MTDKTIDMAREAGMNVHFASRHKTYLAAFEAIVRAEEREACADLCDDYDALNWDDYGDYITGLGDMIRERGKP